MYVPRDPAEKAMQRALMQYFMPYYRETARKALIKAGLEHLIGSGRDCLVPAGRPQGQKKDEGRKPEAGRKAQGKKAANNAPSRCRKK